MEELNSQIERYSPGFAQIDQWRSESSYTGFKGQKMQKEDFNAKIEGKEAQYKELSNPVNFDQKVNQQQQVLTSAISGITQGDTSLAQAIANFQNANLKMEEGILKLHFNSSKAIKP